MALAALLVYLRTLAPGITLGDGPELTTAVYQLGVAHPTGYPLYTLVGHLLMSLMPFFSPALVLNLFSAMCGAMAVGTLCLLLLQITRNRVASATGSLLFAFGITFWSQAVVTEVYALHMLFVISVLFALVKWDSKGGGSRRTSEKWMLGAAALFGLSLSHHMSTVLLAPGVLYFLITSPGRATAWKNSGRIAALVILPLLFYLYLPVAAFRDAPENWGDPRNLHNFLGHVTGAQYRDMMGVRNLPELESHLREYFGRPVEDVNPGHLFAEYNYFIWFAPIGVYYLFRRSRRVFITTLLIYLVALAWALNYRIADVEVYYLVPHLMVAIWIASGIHAALFAMARFWRRVIHHGRVKRKGLRMIMAIPVLCLPAFSLTGNWQANNLRENRTASTLGRTILGFLKPNAVLIGGGDNLIFPVVYMHYVEHVRPDVTVLYLQNITYINQKRLVARLDSQNFRVRPPNDGELARSRLPAGYMFLRQLLADNLTRRPMYLLGVDDLRLKNAAAKGAIPGYIPVRIPFVPLAEIKPPVRHSGRK